MDKDTALRLALEALERYVNEDEVIEGMRGNEPWVETKRMGEKAITAIKAALEAKYEPVAWMSEEDDCIFLDKDKPNPMDYDFWTPLYTTPPQRTWVGLTPEDTFEIGERLGLSDIAWVDLMQAIEAKLKQKNE
jgi:hypothetical protein